MIGYTTWNGGHRLAELAERERSLQNLANFDAQENLPLRPVESPVDDGLSQKQRMAIEHLVAGRSITLTAPAIGVSRQTLYNWKADPRFARALARRGIEVLDALSSRSRSILQQAARRVERSARSGLTFDQAVRLLRCRHLWDMATLSPREDEAAGDVPVEDEDGNTRMTGADMP